MAGVDLTPRGTRGRGFPKLARVLFRLFGGLQVPLFRRMGRRMRVQGRPLLLLTTIGAKTGLERTTTLGHFPDAKGGWLVVASNAGSASHPSWCVNLAKHPDRAWVELEGRRFPVRAKSLRGAEREAAWSLVTSLAPGYGAYQETTDREIPVVRLTPLERV
jgi:deazaflavin-dependent oxidoreductase (nitroreductase family)